MAWVIVGVWAPASYQEDFHRGSAVLFITLKSSCTPLTLPWSEAEVEQWFVHRACHDIIAPALSKTQNMFDRHFSQLDSARFFIVKYSLYVYVCIFVYIYIATNRATYILDFQNPSVCRPKNKKRIVLVLMHGWSIIPVLDSLICRSCFLNPCVAL